MVKANNDKILNEAVQKSIKEFYRPDLVYSHPQLNIVKEVKSQSQV